MRLEVTLASGERLACDAHPPGTERVDSPWILFLHGLGSNREGEKVLFLEEAMRAEGRGFARFDFRGHGSSEGRFEDLTLSGLLADVHAVLQALRQGAAGTPLRRVLLVGSSLGGLTSAWYRALHPAEVDGQLLIAPAFRIVDRYLEGLGEFGCARWEREGIYHFVGPWFEFKLRHAVVVDWRSYPHDDLVRRTRAPTRILHGDRDPSVPLRFSQEFVAACPHPPTLHTVPGGDHRLADHHERVLEELRLLLADVDARGSRRGA